MQMFSEDEINKFIGQQITLFRKEKKISRTKFAKILDISQQQLSKYEDGSNRISFAKLIIISQTFKIDINFFYEGLFKNNVASKEYKNVKLLNHYFLNIKKESTQNLVLSITRELSKK